MTAPTPPVRHRASRHDDHVGSLVMAVDRSVRSCGGRCAPADLLAGLDHATLPRNARGLDQGLLDIGTDRALRARGHDRSVDALDVNVRPLSLAYSDIPRCLSTSGCWCDASQRSVDVRLGDVRCGTGARFIACPHGTFPRTASPLQPKDRPVSDRRTRAVSGRDAAAGCRRRRPSRARGLPNPRRHPRSGTGALRPPTRHRRPGPIAEPAERQRAARRLTARRAGAVAVEPAADIVLDVRRLSTRFSVLDGAVPAAEQEADRELRRQRSGARRMAAEPAIARRG